MRWISAAAAFVMTVLLSGCAGTAFRSMAPVPQSTSTGTITIRLTDPHEVSVLVDGELVLDEERVKGVVIEDVATGTREVRVVGSAGDRARPVDETLRLEVRPGEEAVAIVTVPERSQTTQIALGVLLGIMLLAGFGSL